ncbi:MAG TPA: hypothetical protein VE441_08545 [Mycobacterium sp.]|jgi:hypothetical protein|nr:hypothetical protein [Mycobacterium sp.]
MREHFVWMTTRPITADAMADFERAWRPVPHPHGMRAAYANGSEDGQEVVGVSFWESKLSCRRLARFAGGRASACGDAPYVVEEREAFLPRPGARNADTAVDRSLTLLSGFACRERRWGA